MALPESIFVKAIEMIGLDQIIAVLQQQQATALGKWKDKHNLHQDKVAGIIKGLL